MANIAINNTISNGDPLDVSKVMANFNGIITDLTDGTKDINISALTCAGTVTLNGDVILGNATADDITFNGRIVGDLDPKTAATVALGSATLPYKEINLDNGATDGGAIYFDGGTTEYIKLNAAGTQLDIAGMATVDFPDVTKIDVASGVLELASCTELDLSSAQKIDLGGSNLGNTSTPDTDTIYPNSIVKAWGFADGSGVLQDGFNVTVSKTGTGAYTWTFKQNMADANYCFLATPDVNINTVWIRVTSGGRSTSSISLLIEDASGLFNSGHSIMVIGNQ